MRKWTCVWTLTWCALVACEQNKGEGVETVTGEALVPTGNRPEAPPPKANTDQNGSAIDSGTGSPSITGPAMPTASTREAAGGPGTRPPAPLGGVQPGSAGATGGPRVDTGMGAGKRADGGATP